MQPVSRKTAEKRTAIPLRNLPRNDGHQRRGRNFPFHRPVKKKTLMSLVKVKKRTGRRRYWPPGEGRDDDLVEDPTIRKEGSQYTAV